MSRLNPRLERKGRGRPPLRAAMMGALSIAVWACSGGSRADEPPTFERDVLPIFNAHCLQCHGGVHQRNGLDLRTLAAALRGGQSGAAISPGQPDESPLWKKLSVDEMPKTDNKVSAANKAIVRRWIAEGARGSPRGETAVVARPARLPAEMARLIDEHVARRLANDSLRAAPLADDAEFLRRVSLDIAGKPPTGPAAAAFLDDPAADKRAKRIDALLASNDFGRHVAERWVNLFYLTTVNQRPLEPEPYVDWLAGALNEGRGWDAITRDTLTAAGPLAEAPQGRFFYYNGDMNSQFSPKILAGNIAQVFLGVQLQCAECHDHPFNDFEQTDFWALAAFFGQTTRMERVENNNTKGVIDRHLEVRSGKKPEPPLKAIVISIPNDGEARNGGKKVTAGFLDGRVVESDPTKNHREPLARWLTSPENRLFARATVNRWWAHFFARGLVNPLNDFGDHNAPSHPELLDALADEFVASGFDTRHLIRCVCLSETYQRSSRVTPDTADPRVEQLFGRMSAKVLTPEQLHDALCVALETADLVDPTLPVKKPNPKAPPPPSPRSVFVASFRNPSEPDDPAELKLGVPHALRLMNQSNFNTGGKLVERLLEGEPPLERSLEGAFLAVLCRRPSAGELARFGELASRGPTPREGLARTIWVLLNSSEFQLNQ